jgi:hypothetical protein
MHPTREPAAYRRWRRTICGDPVHDCVIWRTSRERLACGSLWPSTPSTRSAGSWVELGTERESLLQVLDENANFGRQPAAGRSYGKDWHCSLKISQKTDDGTFSEFCGEEPCWGLGDPQMFKDAHPHLFNIAGSKDSCGDNMLRLLSRAKAPGLCGSPLDKNHRSKALEIGGRFR